ncbi:reverse transcriptase [Phytophthora palmivora]|uniref:Reverse transcriptase n=1 Tax=Phytophthora palmivora TaxID=4796 RepID=A0A2P4X5H5_9STRA|nr:reverse transcriptase [Phytophthora palmivora]
MERINRAQDEEKWIVDLKAYLQGDVQDLTSTEAKNCSKIADRYETDESGLLFYFPPTKQSDEDRDLVAKLVSVQRYVGQCIDCETGKGRPTIHRESPGNLQATYPF